MDLQYSVLSLFQICSVAAVMSKVSVFCPTEISLFYFDQSVVTLVFLQKDITYTTLPSLSFST